MQRGHPYPMQQLFPYAECVSRVGSRLFEFLNFLFFFIFFYLFFFCPPFIFIPLACTHVYNDTSARNSDVYTLDSTIKGEKVGREIVNRISLRSIKHPTPSSSNNNIEIHRTD